MRGQRVFFHQLSGDFAGKRRIDSALDVNLSEFVALELDIFLQLLAFARELGLLDVGLRADRHVFAGRHRHAASDQTGDSGEQDVVTGRRRRGDTHDQFAVEMMPSLAPRTAARSQPMRLTK